MKTILYTLQNLSFDEDERGESVAQALDLLAHA